MDPVAQTSRWMAAARAGPEGFAWLNRMERALPWALLWGGPALYVVMRTRFFDEFLLRGSRSAGVRQVVLLAAGMDTRAFRLGWPPGMRLYELDRPEVLKAKEEVVARAGARPACERRVIGADLAYPSWSEALLEAGYKPSMAVPPGLPLLAMHNCAASTGWWHL